MTLLSVTALATKALYRLGDSNSKAWALVEMKDLIVIATQQFVEESDCAWGVNSLVLRPGIAVYTLPPRVFKIERVVYLNREIFPVYTSDLERVYPDYATTRGEPVAYILDKDGLRTIRFMQIPSVAGVVSIEGWEVGIYYPSPSTPTVNLSDRQQKYCLDLAQSLALDREGPGQDQALSSHYKQRYSEGVRRTRSHMQRLFLAQRRGLGVGAFGSETDPQNDNGMPRPRLPFGYVPIRGGYRGPGRMS